MPFEKGNSGNPEKVFSSTNQPERNGRKKDYFKDAMEKLAGHDGYFPVAQTEITGLLGVEVGADGKPILTIRGEWAELEGSQTKDIALIVVRLPDADAIVAQWFRDAKSRLANVRMRSRETLIERLHGKPVQPLSNDPENPITANIQWITPGENK